MITEDGKQQVRDLLEKLLLDPNVDIHVGRDVKRGPDTQEGFRTFVPATKRVTLTVEGADV